jgi:hypothetical protein
MSESAPFTYWRTLLTPAAAAQAHAAALAACQRPPVSFILTRTSKATLLHLTAPACSLTLQKTLLAEA